MLMKTPCRARMRFIILNLQITQMIFTKFGAEIIIRRQVKVLLLTSQTPYYQYGGRQNVSDFSDT